MDFLEKDLEQIIYDAAKTRAGRMALLDRGLVIDGVLKRQLYIGEYGTADLVSFAWGRYPDGNGRICSELKITVYELKKNSIGTSAFLQALGYAKGIRRYLDLRAFNYNTKFAIVLIGATLDTKSSYVYLADFLTNDDELELMNYIYSYTLDGIEFICTDGYSLNEEGFVGKTNAQ